VCGVCLVGAVAQLGERLVRNEEVSGSIPLSSTKTSSKKFRISPKSSVNAGFFTLYCPTRAHGIY
jgi:hypothetical protein